MTFLFSFGVNGTIQRINCSAKIAEEFKIENGNPAFNGTNY